jgi:hypothetical protein
MTLPTCGCRKLWDANISIAMHGRDRGSIAAIATQQFLPRACHRADFYRPRVMVIRSCAIATA